MNYKSDEKKKKNESSMERMMIDITLRDRKR